jgi:exopolyphosphatase / guanosine-5'-triphosphate,3'-diphosphate pyrophosphatase
MSEQRNAILAIAQRYEYDAEHAHQVECLAGTLFMELEPLHELAKEDRKLLEYAAVLHDIGYFVEARGHHRHTLQMIMMEPLPEFTREEKLVIANVARYHRKALPVVDHTAFGILPDADKRRVLFLASLLRVADALDRSHQRAVQELTCEIHEHGVTMIIGTDSELEMESAALGRKIDMFRQVYRRDIEVIAVQPRLPGSSAPAEFAFEGAG